MTRLQIFTWLGSAVLCIALVSDLQWAEVSLAFLIGAALEGATHYFTNRNTF